MQLNVLVLWEGNAKKVEDYFSNIKISFPSFLSHFSLQYHKGNHITSGTRSMIVAFMDNYDPGVIDDSRANDDLEEYAEDVFYA